MAEFPTLKNPPIVEALLDVRAIFPEAPALEKLAILHEKFEQEYPVKEELRMIQFHLQQQWGKPPITSTQNQDLRGYRFLSEDKKQIIQCRLDGFTFNRLAPYGRWEDFIDVACRAWRAYFESLPEAKIVRIGLRYINRILLPTTEGKIDLEEYFTFRPSVPDLKGLTYLAFMSQTTFHDEKTGLDVNWITAKQPVRDPNHLPIVLDIDVYASGPRVQQSHPPEAWEIMRELKNRLFFGSLTPKGVELFQ